MIINTLKKNKGFTLIELMVSISIFMMIMTVAMGSLLITLDAKKKAEALNFTMDNLNFAMESMTRSLRMGTSYYCTSGNITQSMLGSNLGSLDCDNEDGALKIAYKPSTSFNLSNAPRIVYSIQEKIVGSGIYTLQRCTSSGCVDIVASNVNIDQNNSSFYVTGSGVGDNTQPSVYIKLRGSILIKGEPIPFAIQTMVSQRTLSL
jgi:prepilin-type N-terminal cleavage/methylation domain-containing protein